jgi:hypothetical protein
MRVLSFKGFQLTLSKPLTDGHVTTDYGEVHFRTKPDYSLLAASVRDGLDQSLHLKLRAKAFGLKAPEDLVIDTNIPVRVIISARFVEGASKPVSASQQQVDAVMEPIVEVEKEVEHVQPSEGPS